MDYTYESADTDVIHHCVAVVIENGYRYEGRGQAPSKLMAKWLAARDLWPQLPERSLGKRRDKLKKLPKGTPRQRDADGEGKDT